MRRVLWPLIAIALLAGSAAACGPRREGAAGPCGGGALVLGVCATPAIERAVCDGTRTDSSGACRGETCGAGEAPLDQGGCVPAAGLRTIASHPGLTLEEGEHFECPAQTELIAVSSEAGPRGLCVAATACTRGALWAKGACRPLPTCAVGAIFDETEGRCRVVVTGREDTAVVDLGSWLHAAVGPDGGRGSSYFCGPLARKPLGLGILPGATAEVRAVVELVAVGNDPRGVELRVHTVDPQHGPGAEASLRPLVELLRASAPNGTTSAAVARTRVRCAVAGPGTPKREGLIPTGGGMR